ncbi:MAG: thiamine phosphate synthase, partial [Burkholderiaceae bacterium]|nr:thiamine phosphate synthase [Burkholderiaceae bacterium]
MTLDTLHPMAAAMREAIVAAHGARFGTVERSADEASSASAPAPAPAQTTAESAPGLSARVYGAARSACARLGFIAVDADCLARAWAAQTVRLGRFDAAAWPVDPADFGLNPFAPAARADAFAPCPDALGLYAVLPDAQWIGRIARAGVPTVQLRFKSTERAAIAREVQHAVRAVEGTSARLFINDHWQAAIDAGAYGVHLGQEDLEALRPAQVQRLRACGLRLGVSTHGYAEMVRADALSPSYLALGAVFPTTLKKMPTAPQGIARLHAYARLMRGYPLVAIGGIDLARLPQVRATG